MPRTYRKTGRTPGGQPGNSNRLHHGAHSLREKAEHLRAESALRAVRTLNAADRLEERERAAETETAAETYVAETKSRVAEMFSQLKDQPNMRGVMVDLVLERAALNWIGAFPEQDQPDWVFAWANVQPNAHQSPPFEDGHDIVPGLPGEPPGEIPGSTPPPRVHTKTKINDFVRGWWAHANAREVTDEMVRNFLHTNQDFGGPVTVRFFLQWALRHGLFVHPAPTGMKIPGIDPA